MRFVISKSSNLRLCVIENSIFIEETLSHVIGTILNIDCKNSKSFGSKSSSLSFNQKIQIIMDIKGMERADLKKLSTLMHIRNKFAHVSEIKTFANFFSRTSVGKEVKKNLHKWYFEDKNMDDIPEDLEKKYRLCFYNLLNDIGEILINISADHMIDSAKVRVEKEHYERLLVKAHSALMELEGGKEKIDEISNSIDKEYEELIRETEELIKDSKA